jgi:hypothetical protein
MKKQGPGTREQGTERIAKLLRAALPSFEQDGEAARDLWPAMQRRLQAERLSSPVRLHVPWFDWALAGAFVVMLAVFPAWIPVLLYYL